MTAHPCLPLDMRDAHARVIRTLARRFDNVPACVREEIAQDAWVALLEHDAPVVYPEGWLVRAAWYRVMHWWTAHRRTTRANVPLDDPESLDDQAQVDLYRDPLTRLDGWRLTLLISQAPPLQQAVLRHIYVDDGGVADFAASEGISENAVYQRHTKALEWLRDAIGAPRIPRQARTLLQAAVEQRRARVLNYFRAHSGWVPIQLVLQELQAQLKCNQNTVKNDLVALKRIALIEVRGTWKRIEYRHAEAA